MAHTLVKIKGETDKKFVVIFPTGNFFVIQDESHNVWRLLNSYSVSLARLWVQDDQLHLHYGPDTELGIWHNDREFTPLDQSIILPEYSVFVLTNNTLKVYTEGALFDLFARKRSFLNMVFPNLLSEFKRAWHVMCGTEDRATLTFVDLAILDFVRDAANYRTTITI